MGLSSLALSAKIEQYAQWQAHIRRRYKQSISRDLDSELFDHVHAELTRMQAEITRRDRTAAEVQS